MLGRQVPPVEAMLRDAEAELTAFADFPVAHWKRMWSTHPLERLNKEINDEWQVSDRHYLSEGSMAAIRPAHRHRPNPGGTGPAHGIVTQPLTTHGEDYIHHSAGRHSSA
jgi:hypothetical protein